LVAERLGQFGGCVVEGQSYEKASGIGPLPVIESL